MDKKSILLRGKVNQLKGSFQKLDVVMARLQISLQGAEREMQTQSVMSSGRRNSVKELEQLEKLEEVSRRLLKASEYLEVISRQLCSIQAVLQRHPNGSRF